MALKGYGYMLLEYNYQCCRHDAQRSLGVI